MFLIDILLSKSLIILTENQRMCEILVSKIYYSGCLLLCDLETKTTIRYDVAREKDEDCKDAKEKPLGKSTSYKNCPNYRDKGYSVCQKVEESFLGFDGWLYKSIRKKLRYQRRLYQYNYQGFNIIIYFLSRSDFTMPVLANKLIKQRLCKHREIFGFV